MADIPILEYIPKTLWFDNQFKFLIAPAISWEKNKDVGRSWHYGIPSPLALGGVIHEILPGLGISEFVGGAPRFVQGWHSAVIGCL